MKTCTALLALAVALLAGCASPKNATIEDGKVTGISGAEATTLMLGEQRRSKVSDVQTHQKPIFKVTAKAGEDIVFKGIASIEIYTPLDLGILMSEQAPQVSENVQILREWRGIGRETLVPLGAASLLVNERKSARASAERINAANNERAIAEAEADADHQQAVIDALSAKPDYFVLPAGATPVETPAVVPAP